MIRFETNPVQSDGTTLDKCQINEEGDEIQLSNNCWKTVQAFIGAVRMLHLQADVPSPTEDSDVQTVLSTLSGNYEPCGVPSVDPVKFLPAMFSAVYESDLYSNDDFKMLFVWTLFLVMWNLLARPCEVCQFCPLIDHVRFPTERKFIDEDGVAKFVEVAFETTKGDKKMDPKARFRLYRNRVDPR